MDLRDKLIKKADKTPATRKRFSPVHSHDDLEFMSSLNAAVLRKASFKSRMILWVSFLSIAWLVIWASIAEIDELTRGAGKIVPAGQIQVVQNLEGGIVAEILIAEGDKVEENDVLLKIDNKAFSSSFEENRLKLNELEAKSVRLFAEANGVAFAPTSKQLENIGSLLKNEKSLFESNKRQQTKNTNILRQQMEQKKSELEEAVAKERQLAENFRLVRKEVEITRPLYRKKIVPEVEYIKLKREYESVKGDLDAVRYSIPRLKSAIKESQVKIEENILSFRNEAKKEWNEVVAEMSRIAESSVALEDKVKRTLVRSPVHGTVKQLFVNTVNGVIRPGMDLVEIVPTDTKIVVEAKIKPSDIAFLYPGQEATVKFTAYDFTVHGGLKGMLTHISADTIKDEEGNSFYIVRIETEKNYLGTEENPLEIIVGMTVDVDIVTGKKTILDYVLKPILKAQQSALRER